ncbi:expressed unknown protein [Seminavis robusta]|uniref:Uncharacterized protein n=1 Tax=Seminavis robusta TaxID=568900 RepID=A0A9N8HDZ2_9STRA|nr:expressed unknown protein [Seminavis robusta]|eukprot:Sro364_g127180.1 n/a (256) ;mRNA; f:51335-52102
MATSSTAVPEIVRIYGLPVQDAVITQGRGRGTAKNMTTTWGIRPKMRIVFATPQKPLAIWYRGTVQPLNGVEAYSYQELKYAGIAPDSAYWQDQYALEQPKWHAPRLDHWQDFSTLRTFWSTGGNDNLQKAENGDNNKYSYYEFDYYPCSFWLQQGYTHSTMKLEIQMATPEHDATTTTTTHNSMGPSQFREPCDTLWSTGVEWNSRDDYRDETSTRAIGKRLQDMTQNEGLSLDGHSQELERRLIDGGQMKQEQ